MDRVDKLIDIIHNFREETAITNAVGSGEQSLGFNVYDETPPVWSKKKRSWNYAKGGKNSRKWWLQYLRKK